MTVREVGVTPGLFVFTATGVFMRKIRYQSGDTIVLKARVLGGVQPAGSGRISSVLPETQGSSPRYRVRFQNENFDRNIAEDEIDADVSTTRMVEQSAKPHEMRSSWINSNTIRTKK